MKWLLVLALLFTGCSNPCEEQGWTQAEIDQAINFFQELIMLQEDNVFLTVIRADIETNDECFDFIADQVR